MAGVPLSLVYVEDNPDDRRQFRNLIAASHLRNPVFYLNSGEDLIERLREQSAEHIADPGIILIDVVLPGMSGYDLVKKIRGEFKHLDHAPLIVVTGSYDEASSETARDIGADGFLGKPVRFFSLMYVLSELPPQYELEIVKRQD
jgi:two-component system, response regulator